MNRIDALFERKRAEGKTAFILYVTAGFPDLKTTEALIPELERAGADLIEMGVPFSDPIADGPTIQKASSVSLKSGTNVRKILDLILRLRKKSQIPLVLFSAYNPLYKYGLKNLILDSAQAGVDGLLVPDLPMEEADVLAHDCEKAGLCHIFLIAPTTPPDRAGRIMEKSTGFIYYISTKGVTGARDRMDKSLLSQLASLKRLTDKPIAVGFGISKPEHIALLKGKADGIIVGSALVREIEAGKTLKARIRRAVRFTRTLAGQL